MRIVLFVVLVVIVGVVATVVFAPMAWLAGFAAQRAPGLSYVGASGSIWNGRLQQVVLNGQEIGDIAVRLQPAKLFSGQAAAHLSLIRSDLAGETEISYGLGSQRVEVRDLNLSGNTSALAILPFQVRALDGQFTMDVSEAMLVNGACEAAAGSVASDVLTRGGPTWGWTGPPLTGVVRCEDGVFTMEAAGHADEGEQVTAEIALSPGLTGTLKAQVLSAQPAAAEALRRAGFTQTGSAYVLETSLGPKTTRK
jgi:hypothetical protein